MKITLDVGKLVEEGRLSPDEAKRLIALAAEGTGSLAMNMLIGFGVVAVALGALGLVPEPMVAVVLGGLLGSVGLGFVLKGARGPGRCSPRSCCWPAPCCSPAASCFSPRGRCRPSSR